ncbi:MAG: class I adenylate-forming enzyme family protein [Pseudomonadota bacterium]
MDDLALNSLQRLHAANADPAGLALRFIAAAGQEETYSVQGLERRVAQSAQRLLSLAEPGARVALVGDNSPALLVANLAVWRAGLTAVPLNPRLSRDVQRYILENAGLALALGDLEADAPLASLPTRTLEDATATAEVDTATSKSSLPDHAAVMYTSGSTGRPKAVPISHRGYAWALEQFAFLAPAIAGKEVLVAAPLFHMNAQFHMLTSLLYGGTALLLPRFDPADCLRVIESSAALRLTGVPTMFELLLREISRVGCGPLEQVDSVAMGSAPVSASLLSRLQAQFPRAAISNGYGTTETGPAIFGAHPAGDAAPPGSIGFPMPGVDLALDPGPDEGVLRVRSPMVADAYLGQAALSAERFQDGWYVTGDRMRRDDRGFYHFLEREDDMMVCGGHNLYPREVELRLLQHGAVLEAAVVALPDPVKGEVPVAFVVCAEPVAIDALQAHCLATGPAYAHPRFISLCDALPLSGVNKIDRAALAAQALRQFGEHRQ